MKEYFEIFQNSLKPTSNCTILYKISIHEILTDFAHLETSIRFLRSSKKNCLGLQSLRSVKKNRDFSSAIMLFEIFVSLFFRYIQKNEKKKSLFVCNRMIIEQEVNESRSTILGYL